MKYLQYSDEGEVLCFGEAPDGASVEHLGNVLLEYPEHVDTLLDYVINGKVVRKPERPSPHHVWDWPTKSWLPDFDAAREATRQAWNQWRDRELVAGYAHNGHVFHSDDRFIGELQLILKGYERGHLTGTSAIRTVDNGTIHMSAAEVETLLLLVGLHRQSIYQQSWSGKDALASLETLEEIVAAGPHA